MGVFDRVRLPAVDVTQNRHAEQLVDLQDESEFSNRLWAWVERAASYFAVGAAGDDPLLQGGADLHLPLTWDRDGPKSVSSVDDAYDLSQLAKDGNAVIVHRAGAVELADHDDVARVGIFANWDDRVQRVMAREGLNDVLKAEHVISEREKAQREYFDKMHDADPEDTKLYDFVVNTSDKNIDIATIEVSRFVKEERDRIVV